MRIASTLPFILFILLLSACVSSGGYNSKPWEARQSTSSQNSAQQTPADISIGAVEQQPLGAPKQKTADLPQVKVAILLPLSGQHEKLGKSMLNAAQMALFDIAHNNFTLIPKDTKGTASGAKMAAKSALQGGAELVLGPVFSASVKAASQVTQGANINMIAFSTDWRLANNKTFLISFLPFDQIERVISYAVSSGYSKIGVLSPKDSYGEAATSAYQAAAKYLNLPPSRIEYFSPQGNDLGTIVRRFADYDARKAQNNIDSMPFDAILMPVGGTTARQVNSFLNHYDLPARNVKRLGTGLMDDPTLASDKTLNGTWFAAPDPRSRQKFERRYNAIYYTKPPRIASLAYDATALAAILARIGLNNSNQPAFDYKSITNSNGFNGVDGIFRFRPNGIVERGLAILEYRQGSIIVRDNAPRTFQRNVF